MDGPGLIPILQYQYVLIMHTPQANYGGVRVKLPASLKAIYHDDEPSMADDEMGVVSGEGTEEEVGVVSNGGSEEEVEMNWNICNYLPEAGSCQDIFRVLVAGHIHALHTHEAEGRRNHAPGSTPIQRRTNSTQSQVAYECVHSPSPSHSLPPSHPHPPSLPLSLPPSHSTHQTPQ